MTVKEIINITRSAVLDDTEVPLLWTDTELVFDLNLVVDELCTDTLLVEDSTTAALTQLKLLSNLGVYSIDERTVNVKPGAKLTVNTTRNYGVLLRYSEAYMNHVSPTWQEITNTVPTIYIPDCARNIIRIYPKFDDTGEVLGSSNISFDAVTKTITKPGETFSSHYAAGDQINVDGTTSNDGYLTLVTVGTTTMTVSETLVDEVSTSATLRKVCDTVQMVVNRTMLTPFTVSGMTTETPEFKAKYHRKLMYGIGREAFLKRDTETYNPGTSEACGIKFELLKAEIRADLGFKNQSERQTNAGIWKGTLNAIY